MGNPARTRRKADSRLAPGTTASDEQATDSAVNDDTRLLPVTRDSVPARPQTPNTAATVDAAPEGSQPPVPPTPPSPGGVVVMPAGLVRELFRDVGSPDSARAAAAANTKPSKKRTLMLLSLGGLLGSLMFAVINFFVVPTILKGEPAKPVGIDDALAEFRAEGGDTGSDTAGGNEQAIGGSETAVPGDPGQSPQETAAATGSTGSGGAGGSSGAAAGGGGTPSGQSAAVLRPTAGVYSFGASGSESTKPGSLSAETNTVGPTVAAVVRHSGSSCWSLELKFNSKHSSSDTFCAGPGSLNTSGGTADSISYGQKVHNEVKCNPAVNRVTPGMAPGASWQGTCAISTSGAASSTSTSNETWSFVGVESVAGTPAWHLRGQTQSSGGSNGTTDQHVWFSQTNGMVLKFQRKVGMTSAVPVIGNIVYSEEIGGTIKSLTPQT